MRILRSSVKTKRTAPLFLPAWPAPHLRAAATVKSSSAKSSGIFRSIQIRSWLEVSFSNCSSRALRASARSGERTPARSVTYRLGLGGSRSSLAAPRTAKERKDRASARLALRPELQRARLIDSRFPFPVSRISSLGRRRSRRRRPEVELHVGRPLRPRRRLEVSLL